MSFSSFRRLALAFLFLTLPARAQDPQCVEFLAQIAATFARPALGWQHPIRSAVDANGGQDPAWLVSLEEAVTEMYQSVPPEVRDWTAFGVRHELSADAVMDLRMYYGLHFFDFEGIIDHREALIAHAKRRAWEDYTQVYGDGEIQEPNVQLRRYGIVKRDGQLLEFPTKEAVIRSGVTAKYLARSLQIPLTELSQFIWRHGLENHMEISMRGVEVDGGRKAERERRHLVLGEPEVESIRKTFAKRLAVMDRLIDYLALDQVARIPPAKLQPGDEGANLTTVLGVSGKDFENELNPSRYEALKRTRERLQWRRGDFSEKKFLKIAAILDAEILRLTFGAMTDREKNVALQNRLIAHLLLDETEAFPSLAVNSATQQRYIEDVLGVSDYRIFWGSNSRLGSSVNATRAEALHATLARLESQRDVLLTPYEGERPRDAELREENYRKADAILREEILWSEFTDLEEAEQHRVMRDQLIDHLAKPKVTRFPVVSPTVGTRGSAELAAQELAYRLLYVSLEAGSFSEAQRIRILQGILERAGERRAEFEASVFEKICEILNKELRKNGYVSHEEMNLRLQDLLIDYLLQDHIQEFPSTSFNPATGTRYITEALGGADYLTFIGTHPDPEKDLNPSRVAAMRVTIERLKAKRRDILALEFGAYVPKRYESREKNYKKALAILENEVSRTEHWGIGKDERNRILQDRLINHLVRKEVNRFPSTSRYDGKSEFDHVLDFSSSAFVGTVTPAEYRLSANRSEAIEKCLRRLDERTDLGDEARAKARALLTAELERSRRRKPRGPLAPNSPAYRQNQKPPASDSKTKS